MKLWINPPLEPTKNAGNLPCIILKNGFLKYVTQPSSKITQKSSNFCSWLVQCAKKLLLAKTGSCDTGSLKLGTTSLHVSILLFSKTSRDFCQSNGSLSKEQKCRNFFYLLVALLEKLRTKNSRLVTGHQRNCETIDVAFYHASLMNGKSE